MRVLLLLLFLICLSSCEDYNSNSADKIKYSNEPQSEEAGDPNFAPAFAIIQSRCISCHSGFHNNWAAYTSDEQWINSGLVHRGDPDNSHFIKRIINSGQAGANMPQGAGALPDAEYQLLRKWIAEMP